MVGVPQPVGWARVYPALKRQITKQLRHGTWYPVISDHKPDRLSLRVGNQTVDVPRNVLEVRYKRPGHFSVVHKLDLPAEERSSPNDLGKRYAVCPECSSRSTLFGQPPAT